MHTGENRRERDVKKSEGGAVDIKQMHALREEWNERHTHTHTHTHICIYVGSEIDAITHFVQREVHRNS